MKSYASKLNLLAYRILNRSLKLREKAAKRLKKTGKKRGEAKRALLKGNGRQSQAKGVEKKGGKGREQTRPRKQREKTMGEGCRAVCFGPEPESRNYKPKI